MSHDDALHVGETSDLGAIDRGYDISHLKSGCRRGTARLHLIDACRRARFAKKGEQAGEDHDGQNEIGDWTGGHDRRPRSDFLMMETARTLLLGHAGERFGRRRRGLAVVAEELHVAAERNR